MHLTSDINPASRSHFATTRWSSIKLETGWTSGVKSKFACMPARMGAKKVLPSAAATQLELIWDIPGSQLEKRLHSEKTLEGSAPEQYLHVPVDRLKKIVLL
jgi:hypothetical protein